MKLRFKGAADNILIIFLCVCLIFFSVGTVFLSSRERISQVENRPLATFPSFSAEFFFDGSFTADLSDACRDGIPFRPFFLKLRGLSDLFLRGQVEAVIFGKEGYLIPRGEYANFTLLERNIDFLVGISNYSGEKCVSAIIPRSIDVCKEFLPISYCGDGYEAWNVLGDRLGGMGLCSYLSGLSAEGQIWYKTDHHWTALGAYHAYCYLGKSLGYSPYSLEDFERVVVCDDFLGSGYSLTGGLSFTRDKIELFRYSGDGDYLVTVDGRVRTEGLYEFSKLNAKDKYGIFLGGNYGQVTITGEEERERLLIIKDSYANSLVTFLARHFDIEMIDLRYFSGDRAELLRAIESADRVLILQGLDTLATTSVTVN